MNWLGLAALVGVQIAYPLVSGDTRATLVMVTVLLGWTLSVGHAVASRGWRAAATLVAITTGGGLVVEALGVATGFPFGSYAYGDALGAKLFGVPVLIGFAWTWLAWPSWLVGMRLSDRSAMRVLIAGWALASWDLFLDPQMVHEGYWHWAHPSPAALPGVPDVPVGNYLGWLAVAVAMMALVSRSGLGSGSGVASGRDGPMLAMYLWTYFSSVLAHAVFLGLPASAAWGAVGMGVVAVPLTYVVIRESPAWSYR